MSNGVTSTLRSAFRLRPVDAPRSVQSGGQAGAATISRWVCSPASLGPDSQDVLSSCPEHNRLIRSLFLSCRIVMASLDIRIVQYLLCALRIEMVRWQRMAPVVAMACICVGCSGALKVSDVRPHPNHDGIYLVYYWPADKLLDEYGTGSADMYQAIKDAKGSKGYDASKVKVIWNEVYEEAVRNYLESTNRIPTACGNGIILVSSSPNEGGGGSTAFRCK